jgi:glycerate dehydrogenase
VNQKINIVVLDGVGVNPGDISWNGLKELGELTTFENTPNDKIIERAIDADVIIVNKCKFNSEVFPQLPKLKYLIESATGYDNIDIDSAREFKIPVSNVRGYSTESVVQHSFSLILSLINRSEYYSNQVSDGRWSNNDFFTFWDSTIYELAGKTLGLYGFGQIGKRVASVAHAFGMKVIAHRKNPSQEYSELVKHAEFEELITESDILSIHAPLTRENSGILDLNQFRKMKSSALLINTARGKLINESDLAEALNSGIIAGAGLDVLSQEPPDQNNPLLKAKNCIITPHQAWTSIEARRKLMQGLIDNVESFLRENIINRVD